jgi:cysteinyl-tRNA synthetase, unknown class
MANTCRRGEWEINDMALRFTTADGDRLVRNWGYQLQGEEDDGIPQPLNAKALAKVPHDLIVIDFSKDGSDKGAFKPKQIEALKRRKGAQSVIVSYISIGEASDYRDFWEDDWTKWTDEDQKAAGEPTDKAPAWLGAWNENWPNSRKVRYWARQNRRRWFRRRLPRYRRRLLSLGL